MPTLRWVDLQIFRVRRQDLLLHDYMMMNYEGKRKPRKGVEYVYVYSYTF